MLKLEWQLRFGHILGEEMFGGLLCSHGVQTPDLPVDSAAEHHSSYSAQCVADVTCPIWKKLLLSSLPLPLLPCSSLLPGNGETSYNREVSGNHHNLSPCFFFPNFPWSCFCHCQNKSLIHSFGCYQMELIKISCLPQWNWSCDITGQSFVRRWLNLTPPSFGFLVLNLYHISESWQDSNEFMKAWQISWRIQILPYLILMCKVMISMESHWLWSCYHCFSWIARAERSIMLIPVRFLPQTVFGAESFSNI